MFSIIMPSYLGEYRGAARNRDEKIIRAINSVLNQTYKDFELIIIADGCQKTVDIVVDNYTEDQRIRLIKIPKQPTHSGQRNFGIEAAQGEWMCYLDIDDMFGKNHLEIINKELSGDWVWFNDMSYDVKDGVFREHFCDIFRKGKCGTSNVCHKKINARWVMYETYLHDWLFIKSLIKVSKDFKKISTPEYLIAHVPGLLDI